MSLASISAAPSAAKKNVIPAESSAALVLDISEHSVCFILPHGAIAEGDFEIPGGALIMGKLRGRIRCLEGSLILADGSDFAGKAEASQIYLCGTVRGPAKGQVSEFHGAALIAVSRAAQGRAKLTSRTFSIHSKTFAGELEMIE